MLQKMGSGRNPLVLYTNKGPRISKRPRLELEQEQGETSIEFEETLDSSYHPDDTVEESDVSLQTRSTHSDAKYIVFESCLGQLFEKCPFCKTDCDVQKRKNGTFVAFKQRCPNCTYFRQWESQPIIGSTPVGNLQLSAATYFTGASFFQLKNICRAMQLEIFQYETFRRHARHYLEPAIIHKWKTDQLKIFQQLHHQGGKVTVAGDMRADSPVYVGELMRLVFEEVFEDPTPFVEEMNKINIPKDLSTQFDRPSKEEVVARHVSRFSLGAVGSPRTVQPDQGTPGVSGGPHTTG
ncbi:uncharacterized protein LOC117533581 [Gymnodraco acuticeps]|uniref:Uncharacterized protein LOC117533581 n=1 Tax=Gymnodraco acuticeps TaxID=8218 RepID=A0A6P8T1G3_GYMAC|nr:uncharacterized protein LOC117533581 [Gymnodraco acuticeps]